MKRCLLEFMLITFMFFVYAYGHGQEQSEYFILHESVGDTIDIEEKTKYYLFPFYHDDIYSYALISAKADSNFLIQTRLNNGQSADTLVSITLIKEYRENINLLDKYYATLLEQKVDEIIAKYKNAVPEKMKIIEDTKDERIINVEIPLFLNKLVVDYPMDAKEVLNMVGLYGYDYGIGLKLDWKYKLKPRIGIKNWKKSFKSAFHVMLDSVNGHPVISYVRERGNLYYGGFYGAVNYEGQYLFAGLGFNYSLNNWYICNRDYDNLNYDRIEENDKKNSFFTEDFNAQIEWNLFGGVKIPLNKTISLDFIAELSYCDTPMFPSKVYYYRQESPFHYERSIANYKSFMIRFGIITEFSFYKEGEKKVTVSY